MTTVNEDGSPVSIEAVYYRYGRVYADGFDSIEEAIAFLNSGEDHAHCASIGVFVDGIPRVCDHYVNPPGRSPTEEEASIMTKNYLWAVKD